MKKKNREYDEGLVDFNKRNIWPNQSFFFPHMMISINTAKNDLPQGMQIANVYR